MPILLKCFSVDNSLTGFAFYGKIKPMSSFLILNGIAGFLAAY